MTPLVAVSCGDLDGRVLMLLRSCGLAAGTARSLLLAGGKPAAAVVNADGLSWLDGAGPAGLGLPPGVPAVLVVNGMWDPALDRLCRSRIRTMRAIVDERDLDSSLHIAVRTVFGGTGWISPQLVGRFLASFTGTGPAEGQDPAAAGCADRVHLTCREEEIVCLVMRGSANKEISARLGISISTVKFHLSNLMRKFGCQSRTGLAFAAKDLVV
jgi:DNA-binding CsgD family transcriptional regulator